LLQKGSSVPWQDIFMELTGSPKMSTAPMREYFQPLTDWLNQQIDSKWLSFQSLKQCAWRCSLFLSRYLI